MRCPIAGTLPKTSTLHRKGKMAAGPFPRLWKASERALFVMTLVAVLMAPVLGDCGPPPSLSFAVPVNPLYETDFKTGTILRYTCKRGYKKVNSSHLMCDINGAWIYTVFCVKKRCRNPGELTNGQVKIITDLQVGSTIEFSCSNGYLLIGSTTSRCEIQDRGIDWSDPLPECVSIKCDSPPEISHGKHSGSGEDLYTYGSIVTYTCDPNFSLIGKASISCTVVNRTVGVWRPSPPSCEKILCHQPQIPKGILVSGFGPFYTYKDSIVITCERGYILRGSSVIHCEANNEWYPSIPTCELNGCADLPEIPYASWETNFFDLKNVEIFEVGTKLKYQCKPGYRLTPNELPTVTCQENLTWSTSKGCERLCCPTPNLEKIRIVNEKRDITGICVYAFGDYIFYMCDEGYNPASIDGRSSCQADGKWKPEMPSCEAVLCPKPYVKNGKLSVEKDTYLKMEKVTIECNPGYDMVGPPRIICSENRTWYPEIPICKKEVLDGCDQVMAGKRLMQCLPRSVDVKRALEVYKLSLEIKRLQREKDKWIKGHEKISTNGELEGPFLPLN